MGFNEFLSSIFGNKSTRDMKEIKPWVEKIKAAYPEVEKLDNDALRAKTEELKKYIHESATAERAKVEEFWINTKKHWTKYCPLLSLS